MMARRRETSTDYRNPHRPWPVAAANRMLASWKGARADLDGERLIARARKHTGLSDLGGEDFRERLEFLLRSIEDEGRLNALGRFMAQQNILRILRTRLLVVEAFKRNPDLGEDGVRAPLFVVGLQRTGTTKLQRMLAADPAMRYLPSWEAIAPLAGKNGNDSQGRGRMRQAWLAAGSLKFLAPDFYAIHPVDPQAPEEDCLLFDYALWGTVPEATMRVPAFSTWLEAQDHRPAYAFFADMLRLLNRLRPGGRWVLKTPQHMEHLDVLLEIFPDARIVQTHRDPVRVLASFCSMMAHSRGVFSDEVDPCEVGRHWFAKARLMVDRALEARRAHPDNFIDVSYYDLVSDSMAQIRRVYDFAGLDFNPIAEGAMRAWSKDNPQHKHGRHRYRLEDFGLERDEVEAAFAEYRERFGIPVE